MEHYEKSEDILRVETPSNANYLWFLDTAIVDGLLHPSYRFTDFRELLPLLRAISMFEGYKYMLDDILRRICEVDDDLKDIWYYFVMYGVRTWDSLFTGQQTESKFDCLKWLSPHHTQQLKDAFVAACATTHSTANCSANVGTLPVLQKAYQDCMASSQRSDVTHIHALMSHGKDILNIIVERRSMDSDNQNAKRRRRD
ncbi:hypothetical protein CYMTET_15256 [Cymbomonas tetramitiformis]|uniref:Uncharacterized protein n=1 Tax=Cymbomonas tetramitiformis TaxID=36881 RepID=A0AAE0GEX6_9CHLO|nr:hypothetical protein CYMTET_15256 [Cymbomonas tetramitiformis]